ncbi:hypothetical protein TWF569_008250 [Orbilia oligospora]|nr:hypothetical protein TWF569_008250 [Orbilia oligospora]
MVESNDYRCNRILRATRKGLRFDAADWLMLLALTPDRQGFGKHTVSSHGLEKSATLRYNTWPKDACYLSTIPLRHRACFTFIPHNIAVLVVNTVTDLLVLAVPIPMIWKVKVSHLRKFIIIAIFGIGIFNIVACICARSALLVWQHYNNNNQLQINFNRNYVVWMAREVSSAVIVGTYTTMYL